MSDMTKERAIELYPWLEKLEDSDLIFLFKDIVEFFFNGVKNKDNDEHLLNAITAFIAHKLRK